MKQKGTVKLSGHDKQAGLVYAHTKHGYIARQAPAKGSHADDENLKENSGAAGPINKLGGAISRIMKFYAPGYTPAGLYHSIKSRFFKMQHPHRFVRLSSLEEMDVHPRNTLADAIIPPGITVMPATEGLKIKLTINGHAKLEKLHKNYSLHIILLSWNSSDEKISHTEKYTAWLDQSKKTPFSYTFIFERMADMTDYMVLCCCLRSEGKRLDWYPPDRALKVMAVGSYDEKALAELAAYREAKKNEVNRDDKIHPVRDESQAQQPDDE